MQAERLRARQDAVHQKAEALLHEFLPVVQEHGPAPEPLRVRGYGGRGDARTRLRGWYLRLDRTAALGDDGSFYVLIAPLSALDKVRGVHPAGPAADGAGRGRQGRGVRGAARRARARAAGVAQARLSGGRPLA